MPSIETTLERVAEELINRCSVNSDRSVTSGTLPSTGSTSPLSLALESLHGPLLFTGSLAIQPSDDERNLAALPALTNGPGHEKRFFFSMTDRRWEVLSAFTVSTLPFFTALTLDVTEKATLSIRSTLFKLSDYFTVQCRKILEKFLYELKQQPEKSISRTEQFEYEKTVMKNIVDFSPSVRNAILLDEDGFIIHAEGNTGAVDELGSALARLFYRSNQEISRLDCADCHAVTLADREYTIRIGRLAQTSLAFAVTAAGPCSGALAHFLHAAGAEALCDYAKSNGRLWGVAPAVFIQPSRVRESWFGHPRLVPHGKFVGKQGGKSFHLPSCQILAKTDPSLLTWFESRGIAIENGLRPCGACNP